MIKYIILGLVGIFSTDNFSLDDNYQKDWDVLTITKICSVNGKQCKDKLIIDKELKLSFGLCGQINKPATLDKILIQKITNLDKDKINTWDTRLNLITPTNTQFSLTQVRRIMT